MPIIENSPNRFLVFFLSILLALIILFLSFPNQSQWFITRFLVNSPLGYEQYIKNHPKSPYLEKASWRLAQTKEDPALYLDYAADFPKSPKREEAMWTAARLLHTPAGYWEYFKNYPNAKYPRDRGYKVNQLRVSALVYRDRQKRTAGLSYSKVSDKDGNSYRSIQLGKLTWLADNLNLHLKGTSACFQNHEGYCARFGKLYYFTGAQDACQRLGPGWRLPTEAEWIELFRMYDPSSDFKKGSAKVFSALLKDGRSGFEVRGGGYFTPDSGFTGVYYDASFWTSSDVGTADAAQIVFLGRSKMAYIALAEKSFALSCRCVRD